MASETAVSEQRYEIAAFRPEWTQQVLALQTHLWDPDPAVCAAYFNWKYERNPFGPDWLIYVAICRQDIVAMRGFWPTRWQYGRVDRKFDALCAGDLVVRPDHRRRGLFRQISVFAESDLAARGHDLLINLSASPVTYLGSLRQGWLKAGSFGTVCREARQVRADRFARRVLRRVPFTRRFVSKPHIRAHTTFNRLDMLIDDRPSAKHGLTISRVPRARAMADLVQRIGWDGRFRHVRTKKFLEWRYQNPLSQYRYLYSGDTNLDGYLVLQARSRGEEWGTSIVDCEGTNPDVVAFLVREAISAARPRNLTVWAASLSPEVRRILAQQGFYETDGARDFGGHQPSVLLKGLGSDGGLPTDKRQLLDRESWDLRMLYSDNH